MDSKTTEIPHKRKVSGIKWLGNHWVGGEESKQKSRRTKAGGRQLKTYQNKLRKLKSKYHKLFNNSKNSPTRKSPHFFERYPTFEDYLKNYPLKRPGGTSPKKSTKTITRKKNIWGM